MPLYEKSRALNGHYYVPPNPIAPYPNGIGAMGAADRAACYADPCSADCYAYLQSGGEAGMDEWRKSGCPTPPGVVATSTPFASPPASSGTIPLSQRGASVFAVRPGEIYGGITTFAPGGPQLTGGGGGSGDSSFAPGGAAAAGGEEGGGMSTGTIAVVGVGLAAVAGLGVYFATRKRRRR